MYLQNQCNASLKKERRLKGLEMVYEPKNEVRIWQQEFIRPKI